MKKHFTLFCLLLTFSFGLSTAQTTNEVLSYGGVNRTYRQYLPSGYSPGTELPVLLLLHGLGDTGPNFMTGTGFNSLANAENFITIAPDAGEVPFVGQAWNAGASPLITTDDIGFLSALIDHLETTLNIDENRVYSTGFSLGSMMTHRLACELSDKIAAVAGVGGPLAPSIQTACSPCREVPVMHIHGDMDSVLFWGGTSSFVYEAISVPATMEHWAAINGCNAIPDTTPIPDAFPEGLTFDQINYASCDAGAEVVLFRANGGEHFWYTGSVDINYNETIWSFVSAHTLSACETSVAELLPGEDFHIGPNPVNDRLNIRSEINAIDKLTVFDVNGKKLVETTLENAFDHELNTATWTPGIYLLQVEADGKRGAFRVIKE